VFTFVGHKEDMVAKMMSEEIAKRLGRNTVVSAGIHWDNLTDVEIKTITKLSRSVLEDIVNKFDTVFC
jgi:hypothetical protein